MTGSAANQAPRTLFREPLCIRCSTVLSPTLNLNQWQQLTIRGIAVYGRPILEGCVCLQIETFDEVLIAHYDEVEGLGPADV